jgi:hypothetical protein
MPPVTKGRLSVSPATLKTSASLEALLAAVRGSKLPRGSVTSSGWGSLKDSEDQLGQLGAVVFTAQDAILSAGDDALDLPSLPPGSDAQQDATDAGGQDLAGVGPVIDSVGDVVDDDEAVVLSGHQGAFTIPPHLQARLYWRQVSPGAVKVLGRGAPQAQILELQAADIFISETAAPQEKLVLISLGNPQRIAKYVVPYLLETVRTVDPGATMALAYSPLHLGDAEFFRWLLWRTSNRPKVSAQLEILKLIDMRGEDAGSRLTALTRGVDMDRPELLSLIMRESVALGPATVLLTDSVVGLDAQIQLWHDGSFACTLSETGYDSHAPAGERPTRAQKGIRVTLDLAHKVIPELRRAFNADGAWRKINRAKSIQEARDALLKAGNSWSQSSS